MTERSTAILTKRACTDSFTNQGLVDTASCIPVEDCAKRIFNNNTSVILFQDYWPTVKSVIVEGQ